MNHFQFQTLMSELQSAMIYSSIVAKLCSIFIPTFAHSPHSIWLCFPPRFSIAKYQLHNSIYYLQQCDQRYQSWNSKLYCCIFYHPEQSFCPLHLHKSLYTILINIQEMVISMHVAHTPSVFCDLDSTNIVIFSGVTFEPMNGIKHLKIYKPPGYVIHLKSALLKAVTQLESVSSWTEWRRSAHLDATRGSLIAFCSVGITCLSAMFFIIRVVVSSIIRNFRLLQGRIWDHFQRAYSNNFKCQIISKISWCHKNFKWFDC